MDPFIALLAAAVGYLAGAISFARVITRIFAPHQDISQLEIVVPDGEAIFQSNVVSATTVRLYLGARYGCLTSVLDMLKVTIPALVFRLWQPEAPYYLIVATMGTVGHNWPLYYRFQGGRGMSPILGGMLAVDWLGVLATNLVGLLVGVPLKNTIITIGAGIALMIPWLWFRNGDLAQVAYATAMNVIFWASMAPELREFGRLKREGKLEEFRDARQLRVVGRGGEEVGPTLHIRTVAPAARPAPPRKATEQARGRGARLR